MKIIDNIVNYSLNENIPQKNFGIKLKPEDHYIVADSNSFRDWRILNFSDDFFEDNKYINLFDYFCIQNNDKNLFIHLEESENDELDLESKNSSALKIELNYYLDQNLNKNKNYKLIVGSFQDNDYLKPYSLFKIEPIYNIEDLEFNADNINVITEDMPVRLINTFTNKVLYVDKGKDNLYKLFLINDIDVDDKRYPNTIFQLERVSDTQEIKENLEENENEDIQDNISENNKSERKIINAINKSDYVRIKKFSSYIGIRIGNENNHNELLLTNSLSDIIRFKLNCIDEEDKYELHFFGQLLLSFNHILNYFRCEDKTSPNLKDNYERIRHILIILKAKLTQFQSGNRDVTDLNLQENKFDFLEIINHFKIVSELIELFLANWFQNYNGYSYNKVESIIKNYFKDDNDILKYKLLISKEIFEILTIIYHLNSSYLNVIEDSLLYFFMFVGRDDKCTRFLVTILSNNKLLLISLCPLTKENIDLKEEKIENEENINKINNISNIIDNSELAKSKINSEKYKFINLKKCLIRIINDYNNINANKLRYNFSSFSLLYFLFSNLLIYDNKKFEHFYDDYFKDLGLL